MLSLPVSPRRAAAPDAPVKVLYVEDHPVNVMVMEALLAHRPSVRLDVATTEQEGFEQARTSPPDLLLLDLMLPDGDGKHLLAQLRQQPGLADVPAILVTADDSADIEDTSFQEIWFKPIEASHILRRIDQMFGLSRPAERS